MAQPRRHGSGDGMDGQGDVAGDDGIGRLGGGSAGRDDDIETGVLSQGLTDCGAKAAAQTVAKDGGAHTREGEADTADLMRRRCRGGTNHTRGTLNPPGADCCEAASAAEDSRPRGRGHRGGAGVRRLRPLRRRALSTARPPGVDMRVMNPWVLRAYFFLG